MFCTKALKTIRRESILKSLWSLSLAAQIDVKPCFTFNSIGQKTAICLGARGSARLCCAYCHSEASNRVRSTSLLLYTPSLHIVPRDEGPHCLCSGDSFGQCARLHSFSQYYTYSPVQLNKLALFYFSLFMLSIFSFYIHSFIFIIKKTTLNEIVSLKLKKEVPSNYISLLLTT